MLSSKLALGASKSCVCMYVCMHACMYVCMYTEMANGPTARPEHLHVQMPVHLPRGSYLECCAIHTHIHHSNITMHKCNMGRNCTGLKGWTELDDNCARHAGRTAQPISFCKLFNTCLTVIYIVYKTNLDTGSAAAVEVRGGWWPPFRSAFSTDI